MLRGSFITMAMIAFSLFFVSTASAQSATIYSTSGDGHIVTPESTNWSTSHDATVGDQVYYSFGGLQSYSRKGWGAARNIGRSFVAFDTSSLPDDAVITNATLNFYVVGKETPVDDQYAYIGVYLGTQASTTVLVAEDVDECGTALGSQKFDITDISVSAYNGFVLNATGTPWISLDGYSKFCVREGHDAENIEFNPGGFFIQNIMGADDTEYTGTSRDPKLEITYYVPTLSQAHSLEVEGLTNPAAVLEMSPEFTAVYTDSDGSDSAVKYRVQVSTSSAFTTTKWDSGQSTLATTSVNTRSPEISYSGSSLSLGTTYYWRIKFWDTDGTEGEWSTSTATFSVNATSTVHFATLGDGHIVTPESTIWSTTHNATSGAQVFYDVGGLQTYTRKGASGLRNIGRSFVAFDTSSLPDTAVITSASLSTYVVGLETPVDDAYAYTGIYQGTQASTTVLVAADVDECGTALGSQKFDISEVTIGVHNSYTLNATGTPWISPTGYSKFCIREGHDAENIDFNPVGDFIQNIVGTNEADYTGTSRDPKLEVSYVLP